MTEQLIKINKFRVMEALGDKSLTWLASEMGYTTTSLHKWFNKGFDKDKAEKMASILGYSVRVLRQVMK